MSSVASECTDFIGPAGYGFVQVSPPAEHIQGSQWWTDYQPVSYTLTSKRGNREQFQNMVSACHAAGVKVIAGRLGNVLLEAATDSDLSKTDTVLNHMVDFHHCGLEAGDDIVNYGNRVEVQTCELVNLADLATDTEYVRSRLAAYDASKHIPSDDIANILGRLESKPYVTQEVIFGDGEPIQPSEYVDNGDVQE
ncbi:hypothetical protein MPER_04383 [Moniliophthora perniciosa FA553]|nr:hypothetical protein MPER_04383 [Moniliophthora perniciosa FA553]